MHGTDRLVDMSANEKAKLPPRHIWPHINPHILKAVCAVPSLSEQEVEWLLQN